MGDFEAKLLLERAKNAADAGKWDEARAAYEQLVRLVPDDTTNAYALANVYLQLGRKADAITALQWVAGRFAAKGDLLRSIAALQGILKIDPAHAQTQELLAQLYAKRKASRPSKAPEPAPVQAPPPSASEPEPLTLPDDHILPLVTGEPVRRLTGSGQAPQGFPNAIPMRYANVPLFSSFTTRTFVKVLGQVRVHTLAPETLIVKEGEPGTAIYAVAAGSVRVTKEVGGQILELAVLPEGSFFGEMALLTGAPRRASVWSIGDAEVLEIPKTTLDEVSAEAPAMGETLRRFCRERLLQTALATGALFRGLDPPSRDKLVHRFRTLEAKVGARLLEEGKPADGLYVVVDGVLSVHKVDASGRPTRARGAARRRLLR